MPLKKSNVIPVLLTVAVMCFSVVAPANLYSQAASTPDFSGVYYPTQQGRGGGGAAAAPAAAAPRGSPPPRANSLRADR